MFVSPFTVSLGCDAAIIVVYWQLAVKFGGTVWFGIIEGQGYTEEMVDVVRFQKYPCCVHWLLVTYRASSATPIVCTPQDS